MGYVQGGEGREGGAVCRGEAGCCSHWVGGVAMENGVHARTGGCPEGCTCKEAYVCMGGGGGGWWLAEDGCLCQYRRRVRTCVLKKQNANLFIGPLVWSATSQGGK